MMRSLVLAGLLSLLGIGVVDVHRASAQILPWRRPTVVVVPTPVYVPAAPAVAPVTTYYFAPPVAVTYPPAPVVAPATVVVPGRVRYYYAAPPVVRYRVIGLY